MAGQASVPWYSVAISDILSAQAGPLVQAFQQTALANGQPDPVAATIANVCDEVVGCIGFSGRYLTDASQGTVIPNLIPPNLKDMVIKRVVRLLRGRVNMTLMPDMIADESTYQRRLNDLRDGRWPIDVTNNPSGSNISIKPGAVAENPGTPRFYSQGALRNL